MWISNIISTLRAIEVLQVAVCLGCTCQREVKGRLADAAVASWSFCYPWMMNWVFLFFTFAQWQSHHSQDRRLQQQGHPGESRLRLSSDERWFFYVSFPSFSKPLGAFTSRPHTGCFKYANTCPVRIFKCDLALLLH